MRMNGSALAVILGLVLAGANAQCTPSGNTIPRDCKEVYDRGCTQDGVYTIDPGCPGIKPFQVRCDMKNGKWIVVQRRRHAVQSFNKNWHEYEEGFGDPKFEFWIGLKRLHCLTFSSCTAQLRVDMADYIGVKKYALYSFVSVHNAANKYQLKLGAYSGNAGDGMRSCGSNGNLDGTFFSTRDRDNDRWSSVNCALHASAGWWYNDCYCTNLNRPYSPYINRWSTFSSQLKCTEMKIRSTD